MTQDDIEKRLNVSESNDKIRLSTKVKRGTGTRDQDEINVKVRGDDPEKVAADLHDTLVETRRVAQELREIQPDADLSLVYVDEQTVAITVGGDELVRVGFDGDGSIGHSGDGGDLIDVPDREVGGE